MEHLFQSINGDTALQLLPIM